MGAFHRHPKWTNWQTFALNPSKLIWNWSPGAQVSRQGDASCFPSAAACKGWLGGRGRRASVPALSSPRRSPLALLGGGSAACGNAELKVRHKYGAKRVFKLEIRAGFPPFPPRCRYSGGQRETLRGADRLCVRAKRRGG